MKQTTAILAGVAIATLLVLFLSPGFGILLLLVELVAAGVFFARPRCSYCGARGRIQTTGSYIVSRLPAYGIVTRTDTITKNRRRSDGTTYAEQTHVNRQERVPTLKITTRTFYGCSSCNNKWSRDSFSEVEDFSREPARDPNKTVVIEREVVKIPCKYCGMLVDPVRDSKCPSCGANLQIGK
jgi:hypothetical protein